MRTISEIKKDIATIKSSLSEDYINTDYCELEYELRNALIYDIPLEKLEEICNAKKDNRLVILPCKVGDRTTVVIPLKKIDGNVYPEICTGEVVCFKILKNGTFAVQYVDTHFKFPTSWNVEDFGKIAFFELQEDK
ncbi:MAG TPA: hypothetical protein VIK86_04755 [Candidatus Paceibacterota bacterium]